MQLFSRLLSFFAILVILHSSFNTAQAQYAPRVNYGLDLGSGFSGGLSTPSGIGLPKRNWSPSLLYYQNINIGRLKWLQTGWGVRVSGYIQNGRLPLTTASNTSGNDTLTLGNITTYGASFVWGVNFNLGRFTIGANADLVGLTLGKKRKGLYQLSVPTGEDSATVSKNRQLIDVTPQALNTIPFIWKHNNGQAEAYVRFWISHEIGIKLGYVLGRAAFISKDDLADGNSRFSNSYAMPYAALSFSIPN